MVASMKTRNTTTTTEEKAHPFEIAGMGVGPYRTGGIFEIPRPGDGSARMFANLDPYAEVRDLKLKAGAGTCACCGMAIMIICVVIDANGDRWGVGSDCVMKAGEKALGDKIKVALAKRRRAIERDKREAKRNAQREAFEAAIATDKRALPGETNGQMRQRLNAEYDAERARQAEASKAREESLKDILTALDGQRSHFFASLAAQLRNGPLTGRQATFVIKAVLGNRWDGTQAAAERNGDAAADIHNRCTAAN